MCQSMGKFYQEKYKIKKYNEEWGIYLPVIKWHVAMVKALIQNLTTTTKPYFNSTHTGKSSKRIKKFPFLTRTL